MMIWITARVVRSLTIHLIIHGTIEKVTGCCNKVPGTVYDTSTVIEPKQDMRFLK